MTGLLGLMINPVVKSPGKETLTKGQGRAVSDIRPTHVQYVHAGSESCQPP
jgi:hypothetical protein